MLVSPLPLLLLLPLQHAGDLLSPMLIFIAARRPPLPECIAACRGSESRQ